MLVPRILPKGVLRQAANAIRNLRDTHLSNFFARVCFRRGRTAAVSATARKLAVIIWNMVTRHVPYSPPWQYLFLDQKGKMKIAQVKKLIHKFEIKIMNLLYISTWFIFLNQHLAKR